MYRKSVCAAMLLAVALLGVGCSHALSDKQIATNLKAEMFSDPQLKDSSLVVSVKDNVATLSGQVPSVAARYEAFKLASETAGVKKVNDEMTVEETLARNQAEATPAPARPAPQPKRREPKREAIRRHRAAPPPKPTPAATAPAPAPQPSAAAQPEPVAPAPKPLAPPPVEHLVVPEGTLVSVRMVDSVNSSVNHTGDIFHSSLANPIAVGDKVVAPKGTDVYLRLVDARSAGHMTGQSELRLELYQLVLNGKSYALVSNDYDVKSSSRGKRSALTIIGGAALGATIGAIAGGGKGAAIGAATGGGGGAAYQGLTKGKQVTIPSETLLDFKLEQPLRITETPEPPSSTAQKPQS